MSMLKFFYIFIFATGFSAMVSAQQYSPFVPDTLELQQEQVDTIIADVIQGKKVTPKDKVEYFSRLTRYGFKNLFTKTSYNATLPYSSQVNPHAEQYMQDYLTNHKKSLLSMKSWGTPYFNLIDGIFAQYGLPKELKYLAVIESNLSANATSWVGAGGPWQFMPYTARDYGLVVQPGFDERRDYYKSTHAAARYLLALYKDLHDWLLVIAAYNGGPGRVHSAIRKSGSKNFWALQYNLPTESRNHVKKFIATHYIMEGGADANAAAVQTGYASNANGYNMVTLDVNRGSISENEMKSAESQQVSGKYQSVIIAKNIAMDITVFNRYNPNFDFAIAEKGSYELILPADKMAIFMKNKYQILNECVQVMLNNDTVQGNKTTYPSKYKRKN